MKITAYHGSADYIESFNPDYSGYNTANNDYGCFFFTDKIRVAEDYSRQAFLRRYECREYEELEQEDFDSDMINRIIEDIEEVAEEQINVIEAEITMNNPMIIDQHEEDSIIDLQKLQAIIGTLKGKCFDEDTYQRMIEEHSCDQGCEECERCNMKEYDGLILKNFEDSISDLSAITMTEYIVFHPWQIRILNQTRLNNR